MYGGDELQDVGRAVWGVLHEYAQHTDFPDEVNKGGCDSFADEAKEAVEALGFEAIKYGVRRPEGNLCHVFLFVEDVALFYDAECPYGVRNWHQLPFFVRDRAYGLEVDERLEYRGTEL
jgi:hypothetical protein